MSRDKGKGTKKNVKGKAPKIVEEDDWEEVKEDETEEKTNAPTLYDLLNVPRTATVEEIVFIIFDKFWSNVNKEKIIQISCFETSS